MVHSFIYFTHVFITAPSVSRTIQYAVDFCHRPLHGKLRLHTTFGAHHVHRKACLQASALPSLGEYSLVPTVQEGHTPLPMISATCVNDRSVAPHRDLAIRLVAPMLSRARLLPTVSLKQRPRRIFDKKKSELKDSDLHNKRAAITSGAVLFRSGRCIHRQETRRTQRFQCCTISPCAVF
jgi:hypothetical protein